VGEDLTAGNKCDMIATKSGETGSGFFVAVYPYNEKREEAQSTVVSKVPCSCLTAQVSPD